MTGDVRSALLDALRAHEELEDSSGACDCGWFERGRDHAEHVADVLLGLSGVAVTQLPEPDPNADPQLYDVAFKVHSDDEYAKGARTPRVCIDTAVPELYTVAMPGTHISPAEARSFAAALLAASRVAEQHQDPAVYPICPECGGRHPFMGTCIACEREHCDCHTDEQHQDQT